MGPIDLVVYSLASPRRTDPDSGGTYTSVLKPIGEPVTQKTLNTDSGQVHEVSIEPASDEEIADTIKVMGGEDWELWIDALDEAGLLAPGCQTTAYTYIGKKLTWPIYGHAHDWKGERGSGSRRLAPSEPSLTTSTMAALELRYSKRL